MSISKQGIEQTRPELSTHDTALAALQTDVGDPSARTNLQTLIAMMGNPDASGKSLYDNLGDFKGRTNDQSLLEVIGIPDVSGKDLHTLLVTDRLDHATYGLSQIRDDVAAIPTTMVGTDSAFLANVGGLLDTAAATGAVSNAKLLMAYAKQLVTEGIARDTAIGNIPTTMVGTDNAALASAWTSALATALGNYTSTRAGYIDELAPANLPADVAAIPTTMVGTDNAALASVLGAQNTGVATGVVSDAKAAMAYLKQLVTQGVSTMTFPSVTDDIIVIPLTGADLTFPNVVVAGLPTGANIIRAELILIVNAILDTSAAENQIKTGTTDSLWIKKSTGAWGTDDIECLVFPALGLQVGSGAYRGGVTLFGAIDIKAEMDGNATYNIASRETNRTKGVEATGANLELLDVTTMIRVWFS